MGDSLDAQTLARILGGQAYGNRVSAPGPGHSPKDRSMSIRIVPEAADGFVVYSFGGNNHEDCRDYINAKLGRSPWSPPEYTNRGSDFAFKRKRRAILKNSVCSTTRSPPKTYNDWSLIQDGYQQTAIYDYTTLAGELLYQVVRYEHPTEKKTFRQRRPDGKGGWYADAGKRKVLYRWPALARAEGRYS
jgi:hypothetical protein